MLVHAREFLNIFINVNSYINIKIDFIIMLQIYVGVKTINSELIYQIGISRVKENFIVIYGLNQSYTISKIH